MADIGEPAAHSAVFRRLGLAGELLALYFEAVGQDTVLLPEQKSRIDFKQVMIHVERDYRFRTLTVRGGAGGIRGRERKLLPARV